MTRKPAPTFVEFCQRIQAPLTVAQHALAMVAFDREEIPIEIAPMFGGFYGDVPPQAFKTIAMLCGRASGKTRLAAYYILWRCLHAPLKALARGELAFGVVFSPTKELSGQMLRFARGALKGTHYERGIIKETSESFDIKRPDGTVARFITLAASKGGVTGRGKTIVAAALDECCFFSPETAGKVNDQHVFDALPARLMPGGSIVLCSTPWAPTGLLHSLWEKELGKPRSALVVVAKTEIMRDDSPDLQDTIAALRERDPDNYLREYCCEWLPSGSATVFDLDSLRASRVAEVSPAAPGEQIFVGADLGLSNDPSALVAVRRTPTGLEVVDVLEMKPRRGEPLNFAAVLTSAAAFCERNHVNPPRVLVDGHMYEPARQALRDQGVTLERCDDSAGARETRFARLADAFAAGRVSVPERFASVIEQLSLIAKSPRPGGGWSFVIPRRDGHHCDAAMALLLASELAIGDGDSFFDVPPERIAEIDRALASVQPSHEFGGPDTDRAIVLDAEDRLNLAAAQAIERAFPAPVYHEPEEIGPGELAKYYQARLAQAAAAEPPRPQRPAPPPRPPSILDR